MRIDAWRILREHGSRPASSAKSATASIGFRPSMRETAVVLTHSRFATSDAKTAHGMVRGPCRYDIVAVIDAAGAGSDAGEKLDGVRRGIPMFADLDALFASGAPNPDWCVIGIATPGGVLPEAFRPTLLNALERGIGVVNGLHEILSDDPRFREAAQRGGATILDIRKPKPRAQLHFWSGAIARVRAPRIAVLGTDCALGKRTTCQLLAAALRELGVATEVLYTGQTGWLQGSRFGFVLDSTPNDFVSGELEHAIVACDRDAAPELILLEGQSALRNPSGPCGAELLLSGAAAGVILQHAPAREFFDDQERLGNRIPSLASEIALIGMYGTPVLAIALNHEHLPAADRALVRARIEAECKKPAFFPLLDAAAPIAAMIAEFLAHARAKQSAAAR
jgi:uncharacterized NAD-dependent epimerase/dehydratase family protein